VSARRSARAPTGQGELAFAAPSPREEFAPGAWLLRGFVGAREADVLAAVTAVVGQAPLRTMKTPGGKPMSVTMTSCGDCGWVSDRRGYRYESTDPASGAPWPAMPPVLAALARDAAAAVGHLAFAPDACLVNRYAVGARMTLHQDRDEADFGQPIVSVSLGLPATFQFGGPERKGPTVRVPLQHGDVVVFGGPARLCFHGVSPVRPGEHPRLGPYRVNLTFRRAR
jgi:alkylated DNA repair protein (DNA oxidative demethylase)